MKRLLLALFFVPLAAAFSTHASEGGFRLDSAPIDPTDRSEERREGKS